MPDFSTLILFAAAALILTATPGPDMLLIASRSISQGRSAGFLTYAGIALGTYCHALAAAFGLSQLFLTVPVAYDAVRWAGCCYLLYLAYKTIRSEGAVFATASALKRLSGRRIFSAGPRHQPAQSEDGALRHGAIPAILEYRERLDGHANAGTGHHPQRHRLRHEWNRHPSRKPDPFTA